MLVAMIAMASLGLFRHLTKDQTGDGRAMAASRAGITVDQAYNETTSINHSVTTQEAIQAAIALEYRFDGLVYANIRSIKVYTPYASPTPGKSIVDAFAEEAAPMLGLIRDIAASEMPVRFPGGPLSRQNPGAESQLWTVILFEFLAALRADDHDRALAALELIPALAKKVCYSAAFFEYYWFRDARDIHRTLVIASLETGFWTDAEQLDTVTRQLEEFDSMGRDRGGVPEPWKSSTLHDVDIHRLPNSSELSAGNRLVRAVFGSQAITRTDSRSDSIRKLDASQRFVATAIGIQKYQLINSQFPNRLSDLRELGFAMSDFQYYGEQSFRYDIDRHGNGRLYVPTEDPPGINPGLYPGDILISRQKTNTPPPTFRSTRDPARQPNAVPQTQAND